MGDNWGGSFFRHGGSPVVTMGYPLVNVYITMEHHRFSWENSLFQWPCSIAFCMLTRGLSKTQSWSTDLDDHCGTSMTLSMALEGAVFWGALRSDQEFRNDMGRFTCNEV